MPPKKDKEQDEEEGQEQRQRQERKDKDDDEEKEEEPDKPDEIHAFLISERKLVDMSRADLLKMHDDPLCPEFLQQAIQNTLMQKL